MTVLGRPGADGRFMSCSRSTYVFTTRGRRLSNCDAVRDEPAGVSQHSTTSEVCRYFFAMQDIARILRKVKDNFYAISRGSLVAMAPCQR